MKTTNLFRCLRIFAIGIALMFVSGCVLFPILVADKIAEARATDPNRSREKLLTRLAPTISTNDNVLMVQFVADYAKDPSVRSNANERVSELVGESENLRDLVMLAAHLPPSAHAEDANRRAEALLAIWTNGVVDNITNLIPAICYSSAPGESVSGTAWSGVDSDGNYAEFHFQPDGTLYFRSGSPNATLWTDGSWSQDGNSIYFQANNRYAEYNGTRNGGTMQGSAHNLVGKQWTWDIHLNTSVGPFDSHRAGGGGILADWRLTVSNIIASPLEAEITSAARCLLTNNFEQIPDEDYQHTFTLQGQVLGPLVDEIKANNQHPDYESVDITFTVVGGQTQLSVMAPDSRIFQNGNLQRAGPNASLLVRQGIRRDTFKAPGLFYKRFRFFNNDIVRETVRREGSTGVAVTTEVITWDGIHYRRSTVEGL